MKIRILVSLLFFVLQVNSIIASHISGGEITWQCQSNGQVVFTMKLYRDCNGVPGYFTTQTMHTNSPAGNIPMLFIDTNDVSPICENIPSEPHLFCDMADGDDTGAVEEFIYRSNPVTLNGVPPVGGWTFFWEDCCRNGAISNTTCGGQRLQAKMYANSGRNTFPCFDSSPEFYEKPVSIYCTGNQFSFNQNAVDKEFDSLSFEWSPALTLSGNPCVYSPGYSYDHPLPDTSEDPLNHGAVLNPLTGEVTFTSYTSGTFVVCIKTSAWKCGALVAEVSRDMQVIIKACRPLIPFSIPTAYNIPPVVPAPFNNLGNPAYVDTVIAGDTVHFPINILDFDVTPAALFQTLHLEASGQLFSTDFTNTSSCLNPPCATITPNPLITTGQSLLNFNFDWVTSCDHLYNDTSCQNLSKVHSFVFKALDDFCPIPGLNLFTATIVVLPPPGWPLHPFVNQSNDTLFSSVTASSYQWYRNDTALAGAVSASYVPVIAGNYSVEAILPGGCSAKSPAFAFIPASIYFPESELIIDLSPNPFQHTVSISVAGKKPVAFRMFLMDALGQTILSWNYSKGQEANEMVDLSFLPAGIYLVQFRTESSQKTFRLVKMD